MTRANHLIALLAGWTLAAHAAAAPATAPSAPTAPATAPAARAEADPIEVARAALKADRQEVVASALRLTEAEARDFWPIYHQYRSAMDQVGDGLIGLLTEYAEAYPGVTEDDARGFTRDYLKLEKRLLDTRTLYVKKVSEVLPATKTLRFVQVENRLDLVIRLQLAARVPLAPAGE